MKLKVRRLPGSQGLPLPAAASAGSSGCDLCAAIEGERVLRPGERMLVPTGLAVEIPRGWEGQVRPRSGLALRHGIGMVNAPGTIDSDYRGEIGVLLINLGSDPFTLRRGDRIGQLVIARFEPVDWEEVDTLAGSDRGEGGFGSTGT